MGKYFQKDNYSKTLKCNNQISRLPIKTTMSKYALKTNSQITDHFSKTNRREKEARVKFIGQTLTQIKQQ